MRAIAEPSVSHDEEDDSRLVESARRGDRDAFATLYRRYARLVRAALLARMDYQDPPDEIQEFFDRLDPTANASQQSSVRFRGSQPSHGIAGASGRASESP